MNDAALLDVHSLRQSFPRADGGEHLVLDGVELSLAQGQIVGAIDFAHPAFAEQRDDAIAPRDEAAGKEASLADEVIDRSRGPGGRPLRR